MEAKIKWMRKDVIENDGSSWLEFMIYDETEVGYDGIGLIGQGMVVDNDEIPELLEWMSLIAEKEEFVIAVFYAPATYDDVKQNNPFGVEQIVQIGKKEKEYTLAILNLEIVPEECRTQFWSEMGITNDELGGEDNE